MIQTQSQEHHDRYSVVVLDWPKRQKQDIECYCIPSSNLDDHGYVYGTGKATSSSQEEQQDDNGLEQRNSMRLKNIKSAASFIQSNRKEDKSTAPVWKRLWSRNRSKQERATQAAYTTTRTVTNRRFSRKAKLTKQDMTKYISSQDELDWSAANDALPVRPANNYSNIYSQPSGIVQPLVQIYIDENKEDIDDSISAISSDTCWQDESQAVVELVLPNVLFCDERDDNDEREDLNSWRMLFPSYIHECLENERDENDMRDQIIDIKNQEIKIDDATMRNQEDIELTESESDSDDEKHAPQNTSGNQDVKVETKEEEFEEDVETKECSQPETPPPNDDGDGTASTHNGTQDKTHEEDNQLVQIETLATKDAYTTPPATPLQERAADADVTSQSDQSWSDQSVAPPKLQKSPTSPFSTRRKMFTQQKLKKSSTAPSSPMSIQSLHSCPPSLSISSPSRLSPPRFLRTKRRNSVTKQSVQEIQLPSLGHDVDDTSVISANTMTTKKSNNSAYFSTTSTFIPPLPPAGFLRPTPHPTFLAPGYGFGQNTSFLQNSASSMNASTADSYIVVTDQTSDNTNNTGLFRGIWRKVLDLPAAIFHGKKEEPSAGTSDEGTHARSVIADDGEYSMSWAGMSLRSLGGWTDYDASVKSDETNWWELGSKVLVDQVPCGNIGDASAAETIGEEDIGSIVGSITSATTVVGDETTASTTKDDGVVFEKGQNLFDEINTVPAYEDDPWTAAKRGDVKAIQKWTSDKTWDWSQVDEFGNTSLFYACHSGAAIDISIVKHILDQWPVTEIPSDVMDRCKLNALNRSVVKMLEDPEDSNAIFVQALHDLELQTDDDDESLHLTRWLLFDVEEGDEEADSVNSSRSRRKMM